MGTLAICSEWKMSRTIVLERKLYKKNNVICMYNATRQIINICCLLSSRMCNV